MIIYQIKNKHLEKKDKWFKVIEEENKGIKEEVKKYLDNKGFVFARKKGGIIKCLSFFEATDEEGRTLNHVKDVFIKEVDKETQEKIIKHIKTSINDLVSMNTVKEVIWDDEKTEQKTIKIGNKSIYALGPCLFILGLILYIVTDDVFWLIYGVIFGFVCGATTVTLNNKKKKTKKNK